MTSFRREDLLRALPYARRYARALAGGQVAGDALVADALRELLSGAEDEAFDARLALYKAVTMRRPDPEALMPGDQSLTGAQRKLLLLTSLEEVPLAKAATILGLEKSDAEQMLSCARDRLRLAAAADVLIIEDEPIIAMDIEELVAGCGHRVVGVAATEADAVEIAERCRPGLILADINLGAGGDGTSAVSRGDLRDRLSGAAADRRGSRAGLRHHQAVRAADPRDRDLPSRHGRCSYRVAGTSLAPERLAPIAYDAARGSVSQHERHCQSFDFRQHGRNCGTCG
jgi:hypothetical protein